MTTELEHEHLTQRKNNFHRDQFRRLSKLLVCLLFVCAGLVFSLIFITLATPKPNYYASTTKGEIVPIQSLSSPVVTMKFIQEWSGMVVRSVYGLNFLSYQEQINKAKPYFTQSGWGQLQNALQESGFLDSLTEAKLDLSVVVNDPIVITDRYVEHGHYTWVVQVPILILYTSASEQHKKRFYVTLTIKRISEIEDPRGIAVTNFVSNGKL